MTKVFAPGDNGGRAGGVHALFLRNKRAAEKALSRVFLSLPRDFGRKYYERWNEVVEYLEAQLDEQWPLRSAPTVHIAVGAIPYGKVPAAGAHYTQYVLEITPVPGRDFELVLSDGEKKYPDRISHLPAPNPGLWTWETESGVMVHRTPQGYHVDFRRVSQVCAAELICEYAEAGGALTKTLREVLASCVGEFEHFDDFPYPPLLDRIRESAAKYLE